MNNTWLPPTRKLYFKEERTMDEKTISQEEIIKMAAKAGAAAALDRLALERQKESKEWHDRRLRNTKLLLSNYRDFKEYSENAIYSAEQSEDVIEVLDLMWDPNNRSDQIVESIKKSAIRTKIIMTHIDGMLSVYETICNRSKDSGDRRRFEVMYDRYISDEPIAIDDIAEKQHIDPRTVYKDIDAATEKMAKLIFGIDWLVASK